MIKTLDNNIIGRRHFIIFLYFPKDYRRWCSALCLADAGDCCCIW